MEGNTPVMFLEPGEQVGLENGRAVRQMVEHEAWAVREDRGGGEQTEDGIQVGNWQTRFKVRRDGLEELNESWSLYVNDDRGQVFDIERVAEAPMGHRVWWYVYAIRRG